MFDPLYPRLRERGHACASRFDDGERPMNKASLLNQLQIDRSEPPRRGGGSGLPWRWIAAGAGVLGLLAALIWVLVAQPGRVPVQLGVAKAAATGEAAQGASLLDASGYVVARRQATVSSKITGKVLEVGIEEGQHVDVGQVIARLDPSNAQAALDQARAQAAASLSSLRVAEVAANEAGPRYQRNQEIHTKGYLSDQAVEDARAAYDTARANLDLARKQAVVSQATQQMAARALDDTVVRAPFAGVVTVKAAQPGEMVSPISAGGGFTRTGIGTIVDMDSLEVEVDVAESFINKVQQGMAATVKLNAYPDWAIPAEVIAVIPTADRSKATVSVRVGFKIKDARIVPEMGARVSFLAPAQPASASVSTARSVVVPPEAVQGDGGVQGVVFVVDGHKVERRAVRLGARTADGQILLAGVAQGEQVAIGDLGKLKDGASVRIVKPKAGS